MLFAKCRSRSFLLEHVIPPNLTEPLPQNPPAQPLDLLEHFQFILAFIVPEAVALQSYESPIELRLFICASAF